MGGKVSSTLESWSFLPPSPPQPTTDFTETWEAWDRHAGCLVTLR